MAVYPAALTSGHARITPEHAARPGDLVRRFVTGLRVETPAALPYDITHPQGVQVVLASHGDPLLTTPAGPGVTELTVRVPLDLPPGELAIRLVSHGAFSAQLTVLPVGGR